MEKILRYFLGSIILVLFLTAVAKLWSSFGTAAILEMSDPFFGCSFRNVFRFIGTLELVIVMYCLFGANLSHKFLATSWIATCFVFYRLGLFLIGWRRPCHCLGNLTDALHLSSDLTDLCLKIFLGYMLIVSYAGWLISRRTKTSAP
jgi:hypothetical protein